MIRKKIVKFVLGTIGRVLPLKRHPGGDRECDKMLIHTHYY